jgi:hypothetical protein
VKPGGDGGCSGGAKDDADNSEEKDVEQGNSEGMKGSGITHFCCKIRFLLAAPFTVKSSSCCK